MSILMGLLSALCWGSTDFIAGAASRKNGVVKTLFLSQTFGLLILSAFLIRNFIPFEISYLSLVICIAASIFNLSAMLFLLKALSTGKASIVAPIASLYGAVTTILSLISGKPLTTLILLSLTICVIGACLTSIPETKRENNNSSSSIIYSFLSALMFGLGFWLQGQYAVHALGVMNSLWVYYFTAFIILSLLMLIKKDVTIPSVSNLMLIFSISLFSLFGFASLAYGSKFGSVAIVTVLSSLASGVTALLAFFIRGERLSKTQCAGLLIIISGVILLKL